jgi:hypothetical protein
MQLLDPDVVGQADLGPELGVTPVQRGRDLVARNLLRFFGAPSITLVPQALDGNPGVLAFRDRALVAVISLRMRDGLIADIHARAEPAAWQQLMSTDD